MASQHGQGHLLFSASDLAFIGKAGHKANGRNIPCPYITVMVDAIGPHRGPGPHDRHAGVIGIEHGPVVFRKVFQNLTFCLCNVFQRAKKFQMGFPHIGYDGGVRIGNLLHLTNLSKTAHSHFDNGYFRIVLDAQERHRKANFVIEVCLRLNDVVTGSKSRCRHILRTRLSVRPGNGNDLEVLLGKSVR